MHLGSNFSSSVPFFVLGILNRKTFYSEVTNVRAVRGGLLFLLRKYSAPAVVASKQNKVQAPQPPQYCRPQKQNNDFASVTSFYCLLITTGPRVHSL